MNTQDIKDSKNLNAPSKGNVPALRFPEFTEEWKRIRVSDLLDFYSTNSLSWEQLEYESNEPYNLHYGLIHVGLPTLVDMAKDELPSIKDGNVPKKYELCKEGDVAFADASEDTNEVAKVVEFYNLNDKKVVCGLHTIHGRNNNEQTAKGFLGYCFSSIAFHNQIRRIAQGTKIYSISTKNFSEVFVSLPNKSEQKKIASLLRLIDEYISIQSRIIEDLKKLKSAIVETILCKQGGVLLKLGDVGSFIRGLTYSSEDISEDINATTVIRANNLNYGNNVSKEDVVYVNKKPTEIQILRKGDIVICMANGSSSLVGKNSYYPFGDRQSTIGAFCGIYRSPQPLVKWLMQSQRYRRLVYQSIQGGNGAIANLNGDDILNMTFRVVEDKKSVSILSALVMIENSIAVNEKLQELCSMQKEYLLQHLFI